MCFVIRWCLDKKKEWQKKWNDFDDNLKTRFNLAIQSNDVLDWEEVKKTHDEYKEFAENAATYWRQRTRIKWSSDGDTYTRFLFNWAKGRSGKNVIQATKNQDGDWIYHLEEVGNVFNKFYMNLFWPESANISYDEFFCPL